MTTLAIYSNKGGVGKTATAVNLSYLAAQNGYQTLLCDLDPLASSTYYFRVKPKLKGKARGFIKSGRAIEASIKASDYENLDILPADFSHRNLDFSFKQAKKSTKQLNQVLKPLRADYDLLVLDCPPTINLVAENVFNSVDYLLVPLIPTTLSQRTYQQLLNFLKAEKYETKRVYAFFSMVDRRKKMHLTFMDSMCQKYKRILNTPISYLSQIEQMGLQRQPLPAFGGNSVAVKAYQNLWTELEGVIFKRG